MSWKRMMGVSAKKGYLICQMNVIIAFFFKIDFLMGKSISFSQQCLKAVQLESASFKRLYTAWNRFRGSGTKLSLDFYNTEPDHGLLVSADKTMFIAVYVDDLLLFEADIDPRLNDVMQNLQDRFWITDLGEISHWFGMEIRLGIQTPNLQNQKISKVD